MGRFDFFKQFPEEDKESLTFPEFPPLVGSKKGIDISSYSGGLTSLGEIKQEKIEALDDFKKELSDTISNLKEEIAELKKRVALNSNIMSVSASMVADELALLKEELNKKVKHEEFNTSLEDIKTLRTKTDEHDEVLLRTRQTLESWISKVQYILTKPATPLLPVIWKELKQVFFNVFNHIRNKQQ